MDRKTADRAVRAYTDKHWGVDPGKAYAVPDDYLPSPLVEMGQLRELWVDPADDDPPFHLAFGAPNSLAFTTDRDPRMIVVLTDDDKAAVREMFPVTPTNSIALPDLAHGVGGRWAKKPVEDLVVRPIGWLTHVIYRTEKLGDGLSDYIHEMGEDRGGVVPALAADSGGRLWVAGGSYRVENRGIVN